jgi:hypothetical protein
MLGSPTLDGGRALVLSGSASQVIFQGAGLLGVHDRYRYRALQLAVEDLHRRGFPPWARPRGKIIRPLGRANGHISRHCIPVKALPYPASWSDESIRIRHVCRRSSSSRIPSMGPPEGKDNTSSGSSAKMPSENMSNP